MKVGKMVLVATENATPGFMGVIMKVDESGRQLVVAPREHWMGTQWQIVPFSRIIPTAPVRLSANSDFRSWLMAAIAKDVTGGRNAYVGWLLGKHPIYYQATRDDVLEAVLIHPTKSIEKALCKRVSEVCASYRFPDGSRVAFTSQRQDAGEYVFRFFSVAE